MNNEGFLLLLILSLLGYFLASSFSCINLLSHLLILWSGAHESISKPQGLELVLQEASTSHATSHCHV